MHIARQAWYAVVLNGTCWARYTPVCSRALMWAARFVPAGDDPAAANPLEMYLSKLRASSRHGRHPRGQA